ncbi:hypothetical protein G7Y89_g3835 [Cudoniella acicularis]|uniref:Uncharacterized protein n=1 Tax=Cudoniella acicularis TaxID=354080 RepID=A0A8H4RRZ0_9HELO|nr:hypothetical protein G7Y89_g3835 [Cudoniella acicularis]
MIWTETRKLAVGLSGKFKDFKGRGGSEMKSVHPEFRAHRNPHFLFLHYTTIILKAKHLTKVSMDVYHTSRRNSGAAASANFRAANPGPFFVFLIGMVETRAAHSKKSPSSEFTESNNTEDLPSFAYQVQDTSPVYYFDRKGFHCQNGMVGAINAPTSGNETIEDYEAAAQLVPRGPPIAPKSSVNVSQIAVTALLSSAAVIVLLGVIIFMFLKRRKAKKKTPEIEIELCKVGGGRDCHVQELEVQESPVELPGMLPDSPKFYELPYTTPLTAHFPEEYPDLKTLLGIPREIRDDIIKEVIFSPTRPDFEAKPPVHTYKRLFAIAYVNQELRAES